ncbi:tRNA-dependent cyclodipeptide synthase [Streptomyces sp. M10(2022)]
MIATTRTPRAADPSHSRLPHAAPGAIQGASHAHRPHRPRTGQDLRHRTAHTQLPGCPRPGRARPDRDLPGNSYFSEHLITDLLHWAGTTFQQVDVVIPDTPRKQTLLALGYTAARAAKKTSEEVGRIHNRVRRATQASRVPPTRMNVHRLSEFEPLPAYQALLRQTEEAFDTDVELRHLCSRVVHDVLRGHTGAPPSPNRPDRP